MSDAVAHTFQEIAEELESVNQDINDRLAAVLPSQSELRARMVGVMRGHRQHVEFVESVESKRLWRRTWLASDPDGPGYVRQVAYGKIVIPWETGEMLAEAKHRERVAESLRVDAFNAVAAFAELIRERVSTFIAYNGLDGSRVVTVRGLSSSLPTYLGQRETGMIARHIPTTDEYVVRLGGYFTICPPGEEFVPECES